MSSRLRPSNLAADTPAISQASVTHNVVWTLLALTLPLAVALAAVPLLVRGLGVTRFGVLTLIWVLVGYFSVFDLGLGRALTHQASTYLSAGRYEDLVDSTVTAIIAMAGLGSVVALGIVVGAGTLTVILKVPSTLRAEVANAFVLLAVAVPVVTVSSGLRGLVEAFQQFRLSGIIRVALGVATVAGPLAVLPFTQSLVAVVGVLLVSRLLICGLFALAAGHLLPPSSTMRASAAHLKQLLRFGGWMTISNLVSPLLTYADRFVIGAIISGAAVAYYTAPYDMVTRLWVVPSALSTVLFPVFTSGRQRDSSVTADLYWKSMRATMAMLFVPCLGICVFAHQLLGVWLGPDFANRGALVLLLLSMGVFVNSFGYTAFALVQGFGRPDLTGKLHLVELGIYAPLLVCAIVVGGLPGAAFAWLLRVTIDAAVLALVAQRMLSDHFMGLLKAAALVSGALLICALGALRWSIQLKVGYVLLIGGLAWIVWWKWGVTPAERTAIRRRLRGRSQENKPAVGGTESRLV